MEGRGIMKLIIDRFEGEFAVCEMENRNMVNISKNILPEDVIEGDVLNIEIKIDVEETLKRRSEISKLTKGIWV